MSSVVLFEDVEVNGPRADQPYSPQPRHVTALSQSGERYSYQLSQTDLVSWSLTLDMVTDEQREDLQEFFDDVAEGPTNEFTFTGTDGLEREARFAQTALAWTRSGPNLWSVTIQLEFADTETSGSS